jgi:hypothetical protein
MRDRRGLAGPPWWKRDACVLTVTLAVAAAVSLLVMPTSGAVAARGVSSSTPTLISVCGSDPQAAATSKEVYVTSMGCGFRDIQVSRSTDGGRRFSAPVALPGSAAQCGLDRCDVFAQAPMIAIGPGGLVYVSFMYGVGGYVDQFPVVDVSTNDGKSFRGLAPLPVPPATKAGIAYGDVDSINVARNGTIYVVWGYGPKGSEVKLDCPAGASCAYLAGDFNLVVQRSTNGGKSWSTVDEVTPGFPIGGAVSSSFVVQPDGTLDLLYNHFPTNATTFALSPATEYFTRSSNGGKSWSTPVAIGSSAGKESPHEWWIEGDLAADAHGDLLATWDTQTATKDVGWLSASTNGGSSWSSPVRVTPVETTSSAGAGEVLMEATTVGSGLFDLVWQTKSSKGYATFARTYSLTQGFRSSAHEVSTVDGSPHVWPGDRVAVTEVPGAKVAALPAFIAWGSATGVRQASTLGSILEP